MQEGVSKNSKLHFPRRFVGLYLGLGAARQNLTCTRVVVTWAQLPTALAHNTSIDHARGR